MDEKATLLRKIPKMDALLASGKVQSLLSEYPESLVLRALRTATDGIRERILSGEHCEPSEEAILFYTKEELLSYFRMHQRIVLNATGVLLHTNLGRALLSEEAAEAAKQAATHYTTLEFNCETGLRGDRYSHVEGILCELLETESAVVVNNNAAAVLLMLSALAKGREVIVSRGELVEIGGSFRVPEVMEQGGCILKEVGTTNKTHPGDFERAVNENTAALLKVHTSNYRVIGFTESVSVEELSKIARAHNLPLLHDIGSGALLPLAAYGLTDEPLAKESLKAGADVICVSGDKLLGGPQAGIIAGKKEYVDLMKHHPLMRALRVDKITLAALEATLLAYRDPKSAEQKIPLYRMLSTPVLTLRERADALKNLLSDIHGLEASVVDTRAQVGGGSTPGETVPSVAVAVHSDSMSADEIHHRLLCLEKPVVTRINLDRVIFDFRTLPEDAPTLISERLHTLFGEEAHEK